MIIPIRFPMNNVFLIKGERGSVIVDTGMKMKSGKKFQADVILEKLRSEVDLSDIKLIVITHAHVDHFGNLRELKGKIPAPVLVHAADSTALEKGENAPSEPHGAVGRFMVKLFGMMGNSGYEGFKADLVMNSDETDLNEFGVDARVIHTPGHTKGSVSVITADGAAITGDLFMSIIRKKTPGYPFLVCDIKDWRQSAERIVNSGVSVIYPSHGNYYTVEKVKKRFLL